MTKNELIAELKYQLRTAAAVIDELAGKPQHDRAQPFRDFLDAIDADTSPPPPPATKAPPKISQDMRQVFDYWRTTLNHPRAVFSADRQAIVRRALESYTVLELKQAIDGCALSPWHMGENDRGRVYDSIELILRSSKHIEDFQRTAENPPRPRSAAQQQEDRTTEALRRFTGNGRH